MATGWTATVAGFLVGGLVGMTGIGGSALMTPFLVVVLGLPPVRAVGTDMLYSAITKLFGSVQHARLENVDWSAVGRLAAGSLPATMISLAGIAWLQTRISLDLANKLVAHLLGVVLLLVAAVVLWQTLRQKEGVPATSSRLLWLEGPRQRIAYTITGAIVGVLVALTSVGGGSLLFVALVVASRMSTIRIVGTDIAHAAIISSIDAVAHLLLGNVDLQLSATLTIAALPGVWVGSCASVHLPERWLRCGVAALLLMAGWRMV